MKPDLSKVHPELRRAASKTPPLVFNARTLWLFRLLARFAALRRPPADVHIRNVTIPGRDPAGRIRLRLYRPERLESPAPALLWLHGGGFILGKPEQDDAFCIQAARDLGIGVVSVDYRCAPEHPFPTPLADAHAALHWLVGQAGELGLDPGRIALGGSSAGAGLAASLAQLVHDRGEVEPVFQLLVYPMLDDRTCLRQDLDPGGFLVWTPESNRFGWRSYLGQACGAAEVPAYAVPARREDLSGLPPAWIGVGTLDLFYEEDLAYARRLLGDGVACELLVVPGAYHGFDATAPRTQVARDIRQSQIAALQRALF